MSGPPNFEGPFEGLDLILMVRIVLQTLFAELLKVIRSLTLLLLLLFLLHFLPVLGQS